MKYDIGRSLEEILKRKTDLEAKKHRKAAVLFGVLSTMTAALIMVVFHSLADFGGEGVIGSSYGAFVISREAGSYVLLGVIFFALGSGLSMGILKMRGKINANQILRSDSDIKGGGCL